MLELSFILFLDEVKFVLVFEFEDFLKIDWLVFFNILLLYVILVLELSKEFRF